jgi:glycosyltransferase involved in cell wall biosynthesis
MAEVRGMMKPDAADHHGSHRDLLWAPDDPSLPEAGAPAPPAADIDAIIVPTARHPANLKDAVALAAALNCVLVTLHSGRWTNASETMRRYDGKADLRAVDVPNTASLGLPELASSRLLAGTRFARLTDTGTKRNLGILLSHMVGWERVAFLDDDIEIHDPDYLRQASALLDTHNVVGLFIGGFPDNSVVCHAYRAVGGDQQSFIGSGALVVEVRRSASFFPDIYNDDWFYMLDPRHGLQPAATIGEVIQRPYDPFRTPHRARTEELGDVLAEGTFWLLDQGGAIADADLGHWRDFLARRKRFIERVLTMVSQASHVEGGDKARMEAALKAARGRLALITPELCRTYLKAWADDRERWRNHVASLPSQPSVEAALEALTRPGCPSPTCELART